MVDAVYFVLRFVHCMCIYFIGWLLVNYEITSGYRRPLLQCDQTLGTRVGALYFSSKRLATFY